jgi:hypothetical protein
MTIQEVQAAAEALAAQFTTLVQAFETSTGCLVHSVPVIAATKTQPTLVRVKVQIPE